MPIISEFVADNAGNPETYTVKGGCYRVRIREKDPAAPTLATFNVYFPTTPQPRPCTAGEEFAWEPGRLIFPGERLLLETVNVASATFVIFEA